MPIAKVMTQEELKQIIVKNLHSIAPETDAATLGPRDDIRETLEIDSFDFLNFLIALNADLGIEIPEQDYGQVNTMEKLSAYLLAHMG
jgi:acyl carrier protein